MIREALAGTRIAITGSTGFLGTALVERLLRQIPDVELVLLVRPGRRGADVRVERELLRNDAFDRLRSELGPEAFANRCANQVHVVAADIGVDGLGLDEAGRELLASCTTIIHSAAAVAFDNPLDAAIEVNLLGPVRLVAELNRLAPERDQSPPHLVAVSTCYVAGSRRGDAPEQLLAESPFSVDADWRAEVEAARRSAIRIEDASREATRLGEFAKRARRDLGAAGTPALAAKTEQLRTRWVKDQLVEAGRARAASLGFPDAYAYTKALAEQAVVETRANLPVSIVRPSIIESAWEQPVPGWIRGFRMAEPIIIAYGRGLLREFPGIPEGIIDVIPVDLVVGAICAVAAEGPSPEPSIVQVASGGINPFRYGQLVDLAHEWFGQNPLYDEHDQPISPNRWSYPGRGRVQTQLQRAVKGLSVAERAVHKLPVRGSKALIGAELESRRDEVERALGYVELYGAYVECEAIYGVERLLELHERLSPDDRRDFSVDPRQVHWPTYVRDIHLPTVIAQGRVKTAPSGRAGPDRQQRLRTQVLAPERTLAAFDLENTLIASNVVASWGWLATRRLAREDRLRLVIRALAEAPSLLALDRRDRSDFLRYFYRRYENAPVEQLAEDSREMFSDLILAQSFPDAMRRVRAHRAAGHRTLLITGALDVVIEPLRPLFDDIVCARLGVHDGRYTGELTDVPPTGETRAASLARYAAANDLSLSDAVAYADSTSDLPMLEAVGFPVAVNPEPKLASLARRRGWLVELWERAPGSPRKLLPLGPERTRP